MAWLNGGNSTSGGRMLRRWDGEIGKTDSEDDKRETPTEMGTKTNAKDHTNESELF